MAINMKHRKSVFALADEADNHVDGFNTGMLKLHSEGSSEEMLQMIQELHGSTAVHNQFFNGLSEGDLECLAGSITLLDYDKGDVIVSSGEIASWFGILMSGKMDVIMNSKVIASMSPGDFLGEPTCCFISWLK